MNLVSLCDDKTQEFKSCSTVRDLLN